MLGVSSDSLDTHRDFAKNLGLNFPLIADDGTIRQNYGGGRVTYLIDRDARVRYIKKGMPDNQILLDEIRKITNQ